MSNLTIKEAYKSRPKKSVKRISWRSNSKNLMIIWVRNKRDSISSKFKTWLMSRSWCIWGMWWNKKVSKIVLVTLRLIWMKIWWRGRKDYRRWWISWGERGKILRGKRRLFKGKGRSFRRRWRSFKIKKIMSWWNLLRRSKYVQNLNKQKLILEKRN